MKISATSRASGVRAPARPFGNRLSAEIADIAVGDSAMTVIEQSFPAKRNLGYNPPMRILPRIAIVSAAVCATAALFAFSVDPARAQTGTDGVGGSGSVDSIVAIVNDDVITRREVEREARRALAGIRERNQPAPDPARLRREALDYLIDRRLQVQLADRLGVEAPEGALDAELARMRERFGGELALRRVALERFGMSHEEFYEWVQTDIRLQALFAREVYSRVRVSDEEVRRFLETEAGVTTAREHRIARIFLSLPRDDPEESDRRRELAERLRNEAAAGGDFAALAAEHSEGDNAERGGDLGFRAERDLPDAFVAEAVNLAPGEVGRVLETGAGLHIIKLLERRGGDIRRTSRRVKVRHIQAAEDERRALENTRREILEGANFAELARERSADRESAERDGDLGWLDADQLPPYLAEALSALDEGDVSAVSRSPFGWHVFYLEKRETAELDPEAMRARAREALLERRARARRKSWLRRLRGQAYVSVVAPEFQREEGA